MKPIAALKKVYQELSEFKFPRVWIILFFIVPIVGLVNLIVFLSITGQQTLVWPYEYPENGITLGMVLFILGFSIFSIDIAIGGIAMYIFHKTGKIFPRIRFDFEKLSMKFIGILLIAGSVTLSYFNVTLFHYTYYDAGPYLTWDNDQATSDAITVCWHSALPQGSVVEYGTTPDNLDQYAATDEFGRYHKVPLEDLNPSTRYYYRVNNQNFGIKSFLTGPAEGTFDAEFSFIMYADPRTNNGINAITDPDDPHQENLPDYIMDRTITDGTDIAFSVIAGDIVGTGPSYDSWSLWLNDISTKDFASNHSHVVAIGNHEHHDDPQIINMHKYYPQTDYTYSITYGQMYILMLDLYDYEAGEWKDVNFPQDVKDKAASELAAHSHYPFKIISAHQSPINYGEFSTGGHHGNISTEVFDLCDTYDVDFYFCGHSHHYEVWNYTDTVYMMAGIGGNTNRKTWNYAGESTDVTDNGGTHLDSGEWESGWIQVDVTADQMNIETYLVNGTIASSITIEKN
ncbi:MAG: hypothetical protein GF364_09455 [Candidatus Lokiarchaeota archaeon]|nr:hypothetical protein [Candidatus Lokiarchaeota archaeon]